MNQFSWTKAFGIGILLWAIIFLAAIFLVSLKISLTNGSMLILAIIAGILAFTFSIGANPNNSGQALSYGLIWALIGIALDLLVSRRFDAGITKLWSYWVGYALVLLSPWFEYETKGIGTHHQAV